MSISDIKLIYLLKFQRPQIANSKKQNQKDNQEGSSHKLTDFEICGKSSVFQENRFYQWTNSSEASVFSAAICRMLDPPPHDNM